MDNRGTHYESGEAIKLSSHWPGILPVNGFEWVRGSVVVAPGMKETDDYLVMRPGPTRQAGIPSEVYVDFFNLRPEKADVLRFAETYGVLHYIQTHFHRDGGRGGEGESWGQWQREIRRFQQTLSLWLDAEARDTQKIAKFLESIRRPLSPCLLQCASVNFKNEPIEVARKMVIDTINYQLAGGVSHQHLCWFPGCEFKPEVHAVSRTEGRLTRGRSGAFHLSVVSTDLLKTLWLQMAEHVCGQRKLKACEAPDCTSKYMDVTNAKRPGACRMHRSCEERLRKRRFRQKHKDMKGISK